MSLTASPKQLIKAGGKKTGKQIKTSIGSRVQARLSLTGREIKTEGKKYLCLLKRESRVEDKEVNRDWAK